MNEIKRLSIESAEAHDLAAELSSLTGNTITDAVLAALREQVRLERVRRDRTGIAERLLEIGRQYSALPDRDTGTPDEIIGYDENGAPS